VVIAITRSAARLSLPFRAVAALGEGQEIKMRQR
jgi:hypothetical protein